MPRTYTPIDQDEPTETDDDFVTGDLFPQRRWRWFDASEP